MSKTAEPQTQRGRQSLIPSWSKAQMHVRPSSSAIVDVHSVQKMSTIAFTTSWRSHICSLKAAPQRGLLLPKLAKPTCLIQLHRSCLLLQPHTVTLSLYPTLHNKHAEILGCCVDENPDHQIPALWLSVFVLSPFSLCFSQVHPWSHDRCCSELWSLTGLPPGGHTDGH